MVEADNMSRMRLYGRRNPHLEKPALQRGQVMAEPIRPAKLADTIADHLEQLILEGSLRPGERLLAERELAQRFDVSRPSLREALGKLEKRGLLHSGRGGATFVAPLLGEGFTEPLYAALAARPETTFDYLEFRRFVEGSAAYFAALRGTDIDRTMIREGFETMEGAHHKDDPSDEADADADFHLAIYEASHNLVMLHIMRSLSEMLRKDVFYNRAKLYQRQGVRELLLEQHRAIYEAVMAGDPEAARAAAEAHIDFTRGALQEISKADARLEVSLRHIAKNEMDRRSGTP
ncbi:MAG: FCD domain-containing protein [Beijerinckiaceae bacterium]